MAKHILILVLLAAMLTFASCNSDFEVNDQWKDVPAVFCVLDQSQEYQYVKVNKCFSGNLPASEMASVSDSLFYSCDVKVRLYKKDKDGKSVLKKWDFVPVDSIPKGHGFFASDKNTIWVGRPQLAEGFVYELEVNIDNGRIIARGVTEVVDGVNLTTPDARVSKIEMARYNNDFMIKYFPGKNANLFQTTVWMNYLEIMSNGDTIPKSLEVYNSISYKTSVNPYTAVEHAFSVASLYSSIVAQVNSNDENVVKRLVKMPDCVTFNVASADENLYTYMQVTKPSGGIAQDRPIFTNIYIDEGCDPKYSSAYGLMASRYNVTVSKALGTETLDSISRGMYTKDLKFASRYDNYYILNKPYDK